MVMVDENTKVQDYLYEKNKRKQERENKK